MYAGRLTCRQAAQLFDDEVQLVAFSLGELLLDPFGRLMTEG